MLLEFAMLKAYAFDNRGVRAGQAHTLVVEDPNGTAVVVVRLAGEFVEVLTPDDTRFAQVVRYLGTVIQTAELKPPAVVKTLTQEGST